MGWTAMLGVLIQAAAAASPSVPAMPVLPTCAFASPPTIIATALGEVPADARDLLERQFQSRSGLADAGAMFNPSDMIWNKPVPHARFLRAYRFGDWWMIWVERGGRGYSLQIYAVRPGRDATVSNVGYWLGRSDAPGLCAATETALRRVAHDGR